MRINKHILLVPVLVLLAAFSAGAQGIQKKVVISWTGVQSIQGVDYIPVKALCANGIANNPLKNYGPVYRDRFTLPAQTEDCDLIITHTEWEPLGPEVSAMLTFPLIADETLTPAVETGTESGNRITSLSLNPIVRNPDGGIMRLKSFQIDVTYHNFNSNQANVKSNAAVSHSVLASGNWFKVKVEKTGIHKISYEDIKAWGVDMSKVVPSKIRLFGNGGGMLPEANSAFRYDDLIENSIKVITAGSGVFAPGDYILFYATAPDKVTFNKLTKKFEHTMNIYSDFTYYFLNFDGNTASVMEEVSSSAATPNYTSTEFTDFLFYENDKLNLNNSGKDWVGERMDVNIPTFDLPEYSFPNLKISKLSSIRYRVIARATVSTDFTVKINTVTTATAQVNDYQGWNYAEQRTDTKTFTPTTDKVKVSFRYNGQGDAIGWLDWVELNIPRDLKFTGGQMAFADPGSIATGRITDFQLQGSSAGVTIWDVTDPLKVKKVLASYQDGITRFTLKTDSLRQFVAWDNSSFLAPTFVEKVGNQDLHGVETADMLIVVNKDYLTEANRLADHHRIADGFRVVVATNEQVYNEFSSGSPDISAIRDFARMLYQKPVAGSKLRYLLLFGDGSFDYKDRVPNNSNRVLTYETKESLSTVESVVSDDFFGILDPGEGEDCKGYIDIGIGRFPVNSVEQAKIVVDKSIFYASNNEVSLGDWRNKLCFVADDGNGNMHFQQVEKQICPGIDESSPVYNLNKIYIDAYKQVSAPSGQRCPDANAAINTNVQNGVLVMNYTGHGGEKGWADESILSVRDIDSWTNYNNMPVFFTATCEFSRFDNPAFYSAGEHVLLNPVGGSVALFTTTRPANAGTNIGLTIYFYDTIFSGSDGNYPRFGNAITFAKNQFQSGEVIWIRNFVLLGDPALWLAYPKKNVITTSINGKNSNEDPDTIRAMSTVDLTGIVADLQGNKLTSFNGIVDVKVFDKVRTLKTLGTDPGDFPDTYEVQDNYIYQGRATVTNGAFSTSFIVPRDIDYSYGFGKISYYAHDGTIDANGYTKRIVIGGSSNESADVTGPEIKLYMNDLNFKDGGITGDTPLLIAHLNDESGINTISNAIGHEIVATLDGDNSNSVGLNSYYTADLDSYSSGVVKYKLSQLTEGMHTITVKAWDVFNNSSEATITFEVVKDIQLNITSMSVYPNPFFGGIKVNFEINLFDEPVEAYLEIFNINGSLVSSTSAQLMLTNEYSAGELSWNGLTASGATVTPGVYLVSIRAKSSNSETVKASKILKLR